MKEEIYGPLDEIIKSNTKATKIYFVVEGQVEILIHNMKNECCQLDILNQGDNMG